MPALLVIDVQNEFSPDGQRPVPNHGHALRAIAHRVEQARQQRWPIAWLHHHNKPRESRAFVPGSWGAEFSPGFGPQQGFGTERTFLKDVYGAFTNTGLDAWLQSQGVTDLVVVGFYVHMCLSTSVREALIHGYGVAVDPEGTGGRDLDDPILGRQSADEVRRTALLQLVNMGATISTFSPPQLSAEGARGESGGDTGRG